MHYYIYLFYNGKLCTSVLIIIYDITNRLFSYNKY